MEIKDDKLIINTEQVDSVGGAKPEPEERPATRKMGIGVALTGNREGGLAGSVTGQGTKGVLAGAITAETTVGQFTADAKPCAGCVHFNKPKMREMLARWKQSTDPFDKWELDKLRRQNTSPARVQQMIANKEDPDQVLLDLGICTAWSHYYLDLKMSPAQATTITHPLSTCPKQDMGGLKHPGFYKANPDAEINKVRDDIMFKAAGKKP